MILKRILSCADLIAGGLILALGILILASVIPVNKVLGLTLVPVGLALCGYIIVRDMPKFNPATVVAKTPANTRRKP